jgi:hypothetical protein
LKAILLSFLGAYLGSKDKPASMVAGKEESHGHLPPLWSQVAKAASGRTSPSFTALMTGPNPFGQWNVADRYEDGSAIGEVRARAHLAAAGKVISVYQQAIIDGALA